MKVDDVLYLRSTFQVDLPPVFVPVFKLELNPIPNCFLSAEAVERPTAR